MPWRFRLVDLAVAPTCCQRIAEYGVTSAVESGGGSEIRVERDQSHRGACQNDPRPESRFCPFSYLSHACRPRVSLARSKIDPQQSKSWEVDNLSDDLVVDEFVWQHANRLTIAKTD